MYILQESKTLFEWRHVCPAALTCDNIHSPSAALFALDTNPLSGTYVQYTESIFPSIPTKSFSVSEDIPPHLITDRLFCTRFGYSFGLFHKFCPQYYSPSVSSTLTFSLSVNDTFSLLSMSSVTIHYTNLDKRLCAHALIQRMSVVEDGGFRWSLSRNKQSSAVV